MSHLNIDRLQRMKYIDGITIIDTNGTIMFSVKFNPKFHSDHYNEKEILGENLFTAFPSLDARNSTLMNVVRNDRPIFKERQEISNFQGKKYVTTNLSMPIKVKGHVVGAIELSKELFAESRIPDNLIELTPEVFPAMMKIGDGTMPEQARYTINDIITNNEKMKELKRLIAKFAKSDAPVFIYGETGTGKELFAHALHNASNRVTKPFVSQNCAAIPENLMESMLFGTMRGSFTGAEDRAGLFELADGGTLFLDEFNSMPVQLQAKLLRVLQDGYVRRLGDKKMRKVDVRIVTASNRHPLECVKEGSLRQDVYYRLCVLSLQIPPIRERKDDIKLLLQYFVSKRSNMLQKGCLKISQEVYERFLAYHWPGNVRELEHVIEYAIYQLEEWEDTIKMKHVDERLQEIEVISEAEKPLGSLKKAIAALEKEMITRAISKTKGNVSRAANMLDIPRQTLQNKLNSYGIVPKM